MTLSRVGICRFGPMYNTSNEKCLFETALEGWAVSQNILEGIIVSGLDLIQA